MVKGPFVRKLAQHSNVLELYHVFHSSVRREAQGSGGSEMCGQSIAGLGGTPSSGCLCEEMGTTDLSQRSDLH